MCHSFFFFFLNLFTFASFKSPVGAADQSSAPLPHYSGSVVRVSLYSRITFPCPMPYLVNQLPNQQRWRARMEAQSECAHVAHTCFCVLGRRSACPVDDYQQEFLHRSSAGGLSRVHCWLGRQAETRGNQDHLIRADDS